MAGEGASPAIIALESIEGGRDGRVPQATRLGGDAAALADLIADGQVNAPGLDALLGLTAG